MTAIPAQEQRSFLNDQVNAESAPVECLGMNFENDNARRVYFLDKLTEKLKEPSFRNMPGFPIGSDEDILRLSDPPYFTPCPNPFLQDFVRCYGKPYNPTIPYTRKPLAVDVSEGKSDAIYTAHTYHTKVPHRAIMRAILHYSEPGDLILDGFAGSGMTGVAVQSCESPDATFRHLVEEEWRTAEDTFPKWGARRAILCDLAPAATFIEANYGTPFDLPLFQAEAQRILEELRIEIGWMYETIHPVDKKTGSINYTVWSEVFSCPDCAGDVVFFEQALDRKTDKVKESFLCPHCSSELTKDGLRRLMETLIDSPTGNTRERIRLVPVLINYSVGAKRHEKKPDVNDLANLDRIAAMQFPLDVPVNAFPIDAMYHGSRLAPKGFTHIHHMYLPRAAQALGRLWGKIQVIRDQRLRLILCFWFDSHVVNLSIQNRYRPGVSFPYNPLTGVYYVPSQVSDANPFVAYENKLARILSAFKNYSPTIGNTMVTTGDCAFALTIDSNTIDYIFTDPPFGENIFYADLNLMVESWYRIFTASQNEAIVDKTKHKDLLAYERLMESCLREYYRVLKPGRWMTMVFHNSSSAVWAAIQEALIGAGFVVADVRTLDKQQGSYRQVTSTAVKQDLVISAYKPNGGLEQRFELEKGSEDGVWDFVKTHLRQLPVFVSKNAGVEAIVERQAFLLFDRMVAFHVQRGVVVPLSVGEFYSGLSNRFPERDGMYFLAEQVPEYDQRRMQANEIQQLEIFVRNEKSAIQWLRQQLQNKPQTFQEIHPQFTREIAGWEKHERPVELRDLLEQNFLLYGGQDDVPSQIHRYLSTNFHDLRKLAKDAPALRAKAKDRYYVPDPAKEADVLKSREKALLREFAEYRESTQRKLKIFRLEAVRTGFRWAWQQGDYKAILEVAEKIPEEVLQEDAMLLMWYTNSLTRAGKQS